MYVVGVLFGFVVGCVLFVFYLFGDVEFVLDVVFDFVGNYVGVSEVVVVVELVLY